MIYQATSEQESHLLSLPETGMGYQIIEAKLPGSYISRQYVAYNSEMLVDIDVDFHSNRKKIIDSGYKASLRESGLIRFQRDTIRLSHETIVFPPPRLSTWPDDKKRHTGGKPAKEGSIEYADGKEVFVRISAYEDDKRIDLLRRRLREGTYTTTLGDYIVCISLNDDPVDRYALPSNDPPEWAFYIKPKFLDSLQRGIVQPAYEHLGGGIETYFAKGTSDNTFVLKCEYGKLQLAEV